MPPTLRSGAALRKVAVPLVAVTLSLTTMSLTTMAAPALAAAPTAAHANAPASNFTGPQLQTTLRQLIKAAQDNADTRDGTITQADLQAALATLGQRAWEQGVNFQLTSKYSGTLGDISFYFAPDGTLGIAVGNPDTGTACAMATVTPGTAKPDVWSWGADLGKNCSGKTAAAGKTAQQPPWIDPIPPDQLTGVTVTGGESDLNVTWTASTATDLDHYTVYVDGNPAGTTTDTSYTIPGLVDYTNYTVTVTATDVADNESVPSAPVAGMPVDLTPPPVPTAVTAASGEGEVDLTWDASTAPDFDHFNVYSDGIEVASTTTAAFDVTGLTDYVDADYTVTAVDVHDNESVASSTVTAHAVDLTAPDAPTGLVAAPAGTSIALSWTAPTATDVDHYDVYSDGTAVGQSTTTGFTVSGLTDGTAHTYTVVAVDAHGNASAPSAPVTAAAAADTTPPDAPTGLVASPGDTQVTLTWKPSIATDVDHYNVLDASGNVLATVPADTTTATITGLSNETGYSFAVVAVDASANTSAKAQVYARPSLDYRPWTAESMGIGVSSGGAVSPWSGTLLSDGSMVIVGNYSGTLTFGIQSVGGRGTFIAKMGADGTWQWVTRISGGMVFPHQMVHDANDNVLIAGEYYGATQFGSATHTLYGSSTHSNAFVGKLSSDGTWQWVTAPSGMAASETVAVDATGNVVVGGIEYGSVQFGGTTLSSGSSSWGDAFVAKLSADGVWQWATRGGGYNNDMTQSVSVAPDGSILASGYFYQHGTFGGTTLYGSASTSAWFGKLTANGTWQWARASISGYSANTTVQSVVADHAGNIYATGGLCGTAWFGNTKLVGPSYGSCYAYVGKMSASGSWEWAKLVRGGLPQLTLDGDENPLLYASTSYLAVGNSVTGGSGYDGIVAKLTSDGTLVGFGRVGGPGDDYVLAVDTDQNGNPVLAGVVTGSADAGDTPVGSTSPMSGYRATWEING